MTNAKDIATYFFQKDKNRDVFTSELIQRGTTPPFVAGNARVNKYLHMAQNMWIARTGKLLFNQRLLAFENGAVVEEVRLNYNMLLQNSSQCAVNIPGDVRTFLDKIYVMLQNATIDELIELSHQDKEWDAKSDYRHRTKKEQEMDSLSRKDEYKNQYADALIVLEHMSI